MLYLYERIKRIEKALNIKTKNIDKLNGSEIIKYYNELIEKISFWEEENQKELIY